MRFRLAAFALMFLAACGGGGGGDTSAGGGTVGGGGTGGGGTGALAFTSPAAATVAENTSGSFYAAVASGGANLAFSISGGADAALFSITPAGALSFNAPPDYELAADADSDSIYAVTLQVSGGGVTATLALTVSVTNVAGNATARRVGIGFSQPLLVTGFGPGPRLLVVEKAGLIRVLDPTTGIIAATPFLNVSSEIATDSERGLLGVALAPDFATSRNFYVYLNVPGGAIQVRRYRTMASDPNRADPATADVILQLTHPNSNHNGGWIAFSPANNTQLYLGVGDGGGSGDPDRNGQNPNVLLGKILRIDVSSDAFPTDANRDYAIPADNPFRVSGGAPEILHLGLRNPWRNSFDRAAGNNALYVGDVGEGAWEEIDLARPGETGLNFGWSILEGTHTYNGGSTAGLAPPIAEYAHGTGPQQGNSVIGGYVYRGPVAALSGQYFFADFINPRIWSITPPATRGATLSAFTDRTAALTPNVGTIASISSFGEDARGNLYITDLSGGEVFMITDSQ